MVKRLNIPLNDSDYEHAKQVKQELGLTWEQFIIEAADSLKETSTEENGSPE
jgi:hypothetical protein